MQFGDDRAVRIRHDAARVVSGSDVSSKAATFRSTRSSNKWVYGCRRCIGVVMCEPGMAWRRECVESGSRGKIKERDVKSVSSWRE